MPPQRSSKLDRGMRPGRPSAEDAAGPRGEAELTSADHRELRRATYQGLHIRVSRPAAPRGHSRAHRLSTAPVLRVVAYGLRPGPQPQRVQCGDALVVVFPSESGNLDCIRTAAPLLGPANGTIRKVDQTVPFAPVD